MEVKSRLTYDAVFVKPGEVVENRSGKKNLGGFWEPENVTMAEGGGRLGAPVTPSAHKSRGAKHVGSFTSAGVWERGWKPHEMWTRSPHSATARMTFWLHIKARCSLSCAPGAPSALDL